jgi:predicted transposase YbfD/YdcC
MSTVEQIESAILKLSPQELSHLTDWVLDLDAQRWDEQIERDIAAGKLDFLEQEALALMRSMTS